MLPGEIQQVLPKEGRGPCQALIWKPPRPIRLNARTELPPMPGRSVYGPAACEEARRLMRDGKREKINLGWFTKIDLCRVARGERPLGCSVWTRTCDHMARMQAERKRARKPLRFHRGESRAADVTETPALTLGSTVSSHPDPVH